MAGITRRDLTDRLVKLFNVKPATAEETKMFKNISHRQLAESFEYWIDQCKTVIGESVWTDHTQSLQDAGVDLVAKLLKSQLKFGIQVKSYGDVRENHFSNKVLAQIQQSRRHDLTHLVLAFGADMADASQSQKVSIMISEISQQKDNNYVIPISAEKLVTIYKAFKSKEHPLKFVEVDFEQAIGITGGLAEALSNESRKVTVSIKVQNLNVDLDDRPFKAQIKFKIGKEEASLMDVLARAANTGETITLTKDQLEEITIYEKDKLIARHTDLGFLKIIPERKKFGLDIESLSEDDTVLYSLKGLVMVLDRQSESRSVATIEDINEPLRLTMTFDVVSSSNKGEAGLDIRIDPGVGTCVELLRALEFVDSLMKAKRLKLIHPETGQADIVEVSGISTVGLTKAEIEFVRALTVLQKRTGVIFRIPENLLEYDLRALNFVFQIAKGVTEGSMPISGATTGTKMHRVAALALLDSILKGKTDDYLVNEMLTIDVLGKSVNFGPTKTHLSKLKPKGDAQELYEKLKESKEDVVTLEFDALDGAEIELEWFKKPKEQTGSS